MTTHHPDAKRCLDAILVRGVINYISSLTDAAAESFSRRLRTLRAEQSTAPTCPTCRAEMGRDEMGGAA